MVLGEGTASEGTGFQARVEAGPGMPLQNFLVNRRGTPLPRRFVQRQKRPKYPPTAGVDKSTDIRVNEVQRRNTCG